jgi:hypothetical protein
MKAAGAGAGRNRLSTTRTAAERGLRIDMIYLPEQMGRRQPLAAGLSRMDVLSSLGFKSTS